jgi:hypothetical protein
MNRETMTLREAIEHFPELLDEKVTWGQKSSSDPMIQCDEVTFQFCGDSNYRTQKVKNKKIQEEQAEATLLALLSMF